MKKGLSLFSGAGIGEYYINKANIEIVLANELIPSRGKLYQQVYRESKMIVGDITHKEVYKTIKEEAKKENIDFIIASPPCQGISIAGKNRKIDEMSKDKRNYLITYVIDIINETDPTFIMIENVPLLLKLKLHIGNRFVNIMEYLSHELSDRYIIDSKIIDAADYNIPQHRKRAIILIYKKEHSWVWPEKNENKITVRDVIGELPSLESGQKSPINWHFSRSHVHRQIEWMQHTPTGKSAFDNLDNFPRKENGEKIKGFNSSYRRIKWDEPSPTITIRNDAISSQRNVHPGRKLENGLYSDARVLTPLELFRLTGLPDDWEIPLNTPEMLVRQVIGESIPPMLVELIAEGIDVNE